MRALIDGRYNVAYGDIDALAYPVLRHRMKINYTAINERLTVDDVIARLIAENAKEKGTGKLDADAEKPAAVVADTADAESAVADGVAAESGDVKKKKKFGKKN